MYNYIYNYTYIYNIHIVIGYERRDHFVQEPNFAFAARHIKIYSLYYLLQFVSLNYVAASVAEKHQFKVQRYVDSITRKLPSNIQETLRPT